MNAEICRPRFGVVRPTIGLLLLVGLLECLVTSNVLGGGTIALTSNHDNTLFEYNPADVGSTLNSNGAGNFFSAGRSLSRNLIRRGLLSFDLSGIPANARVARGSARLELYVVSAPSQDATPRPFWVTPAASPWGEGPSSINSNVSGAGSGVLAQAGDATWYHTSFDPAVHTGQPFQPNAAGYWSMQGGLGGTPINTPNVYGTPAATVPSSVGPATLTGQSLENNLNAWLSGGTPNYGWFVLGDESVGGTTVSSLRSFASHEHANLSFRPTLRFDFVLTDFNADDSVDGADVAFLYTHWNTAFASADVTGDGTVDGADLAIVYGEWTGDSQTVGQVSVPEPAARVLILAVCNLFAVAFRRRLN